MDSYQLQLKLAFSGTKDGAPQQWQTAIQRTYIRKSGTLFTLLNNSFGAATQAMAFGDVGAAHYLQPAADQPCGVSWGDHPPTTAPAFDPTALLPPVYGAEAGDASITNGASTRQYSFDQRAVARGSGVQAAGHLWVTTQGGWVAKYSLQVTGGEAYFDKGIQGQQTWEYDLTDAGKLTGFDLPAGCPAIPTDIPTLPGAMNVVRLPAYLSFRSTSALGEAVSLYQTELKMTGWQVLADAKPAAGAKQLVFAHADGRRAVASFKKTGANLAVTVQITASPPK